MKWDRDPGDRSRRAPADNVGSTFFRSAVGRVAFAALALAVLDGCGFGVPLKSPTDVPEQAERSATIRLGEATRADVRAVLGEPWIGSDFWRAEVYRTDDKRTELGFMMAVVVPVPVGVYGEKRHGHVLVAYDREGRVSSVAAGAWSEGVLASTAARWMTLRAGDVSLVIDPVGTKTRSTLLATRGRLDDYLAVRRRIGGCTLVVGCASDSGCPDEIALDGGDPIDPSSVTALCAASTACPEGSPIPGASVDGKSLVAVPVLLAIRVAPGRHRLGISSSRIKGAAEMPFECSSGEVVYGAVRSRAEGAGFWTKGRLEATVAFSAEPLESWASHGFELARDGRWLVESEPSAQASEPAP